MYKEVSNSIDYLYCWASRLDLFAMTIPKMALADFVLSLSEKNLSIAVTI